MRPRSNGDHDSGGAVESLDLGVGWKDMVYDNYWGHHFGELNSLLWS